MKKVLLSATVCMEIWSNEIPEAYKGVCKVSLP